MGAPMREVTLTVEIFLYLPMIFSLLALQKQNVLIQDYYG